VPDEAIFNTAFAHFNPPLKDGQRLIIPSIMRWVSPDPIVPGIGEGGNPNAVGCLGSSNYSPLTVDYHENQLLEQLNLENKNRLEDRNFKLPPVPTNVIAFDRYAYSLNNPIRYTDPTGHCPFCIAIPLVGVPGVGWVILGVAVVATVAYYTAGGPEAVAQASVDLGENVSQGFQALFAKGEYEPRGLSHEERIAYREAVHRYKKIWGLGVAENVTKEILDEIADAIKEGQKPIDAAESADGPQEDDNGD
jgi:hypothetical protein